jgi:hypothetical protein
VKKFVAVSLGLALGVQALAPMALADRVDNVIALSAPQRQAKVNDLSAKITDAQSKISKLQTQLEKARTNKNRDIIIRNTAMGVTLAAIVLVAYEAHDMKGAEVGKSVGDSIIALGGYAVGGLGAAAGIGSEIGVVLSAKDAKSLGDKLALSQTDLQNLQNNLADLR